MTLSPAFLDELRARTTLSTLVGRTTKLQRAGREWKAPCPFHNEKTPSFYVNDDKGFYHCFGCGAHGDAIRWMTDQRGLPFMEAVKELAQAAGMEMPAPDPRAAERTERQKSLHDVTGAAADWFEQQLSGIDGNDARELLKRRGIDDATRRAFALGYAPDSRGKLRTALRDFGDARLVETGLLIAVDDKEPYDRFRGRLMIPIRDPRGRTIAFGGRIIGDASAGAAQAAKYLNSPETPLFDKGRTLFNLDRAAGPARKAGRIIAVEGYMDVIALAQAGIEEAVAPLGTALTEAQLEALWRFADVPLLCFDGDAAGQKAALRAAHRALPLLQPGRSLAFVTLPAGMDPDDLVRAQGRAAFDALAERAEPLVERLWTSEQAAAPLATPEARAGLRRRLTELARGIAEPSVREEYLAEFRRRFDALFAAPPGPSAVRRTAAPRGRRGFAPLRLDHAPVTEQARAASAAPIDALLMKAVLAGLIRHPQEIARHAETLAALQLSDGPLARLLGAVIDVALHDRALDSDRLVTILASTGFNHMAGELLRADGISLTARDDDAARVRLAIDEAVAIMVARPQVDAALAAATRRMEATIDEDAFAEQQRLRAMRSELDERLANLLQADKDA